LFFHQSDQFVTDFCTVITENFTVITENFTVITENFTVITENFTVITENCTAVWDYEKNKTIDTQKIVIILINVSTRFQSSSGNVWD
jgi:aminoglycoside N3'-acetyltransferase